jgi:hypothetical protein
LSSIRDLVNLLFPLVLSLILLRIRPISFLFFVALFAFSEMRGWHGFHAQPVWAISAFTVGLVLCSSEFSIFRALNINLNSKIFFVGKVIICISIIAFMMYPWAKMATKPVPAGGLSFSKHLPGTKEKIVQSLVPVGGTYTDTSLDIMNFVETQRDPAGGIGGIVPWFTELYEQEFISKISRDKPVIIFHDPNVEVWGHKLKDYAPNLNGYLLENYTPILLNEADFNEGFYVRNDQVNRILPIIFKMFPSSKFAALNKISQLDAFPSAPVIIGTDLKQSIIVPRSDLKAIQILTATYARQNKCNIKISLLANKELLVMHNYSCSEIPDNGYLMFDFSELVISGGQVLELAISSDSSSELNAISVWENPNPPSFSGDLFQGSSKISASLIFNLLYNKTEG